EKAWEENLAANRAIYGEESREVASTLIDMAGLYYPMQRVADAERVSKEGLAMARRTVPPGDHLILYGANQTAFLLAARGAWSEVLALKEEIYDIEKSQRAAGVVENGINLTDIGETRLALKQYDEARQVLEEALAIREKGLSPGSWRTENTRSLLGVSLAGLGRRAEAEKLLTSSVSAIAASKDAPPEVKSKAQARLAALRQ
ncbi:MAG TPA: tetratricopeptide repeat protein, partial [Candidatus Polarisedimenticolia bacterium]|nr:tetratricopeptide repeat protein [Candidatus Polarisedimenticolia bacterium]